MMRSLRARLIVGLVAGLALLLAGSGTVIYLLLERALVGEVDQSLAATVRLVIPLIELDEGRIDLDLGRVPLSERAKAQNLVELSQADGAVVARSPLLGDHNLPRLAGSIDHPASLSFRLANGQPARAMGIEFTYQQEHPAAAKAPSQPLVLVVARQTTELQDQLRHMRWILLAAFGGILVLASLIGVVVISRGLRPVRRLAGQIGRIQSHNLSARMAEEHLPAELVPVAAGLNALLGRLDAAFVRERAFTSDVAHELRTPLAALRSITEVALARDRGARDYAQALGQVQPVVQSMQAMVGKLLALARMDAGQIPLAPGPLNLRQALADVWAACGDAAPRNLTFENLLSEDIFCLADQDLLSIALVNVLGNAAEYSDAGGRVWCAARRAGDQVSLSVSNTGCHLDPRDAPKVFDRFWRGDAARTGTEQHSGLGLALTQRAIILMGGRITARVEPQGVFSLEIHLPAAPVPEPRG